MMPKRPVYMVLILILILGGCSTFDYSKQLKQVAFTDNIKKGKSIGPIEGRDCVWQFFGLPIGTRPSMDRALKAAMKNYHLTGAEINSSSRDEQNSAKNQKAEDTNAIRYINNIITANEGFNFGVFRKQCLIVSGIGYL